jgi:hypothetical protein
MPGTAYSGLGYIYPTGSGLVTCAPFGFGGFVQVGRGAGVVGTLADA